MAKVSNILIGILNIITLLASILIIGSWWFIRTHAGPDGSLRLYLWPILGLGIFVMVLSLLGLFGACCRISFFLSLYLLFTFVLFLGLCSLLWFMFVVTSIGSGEAVPGRAYKEYRLGSYSRLLQRAVASPDTWNGIVEDLKNAKVCTGFEAEGPVGASEFYRMKLTSIQSGCCKPPTYCGYTYKNATYWTTPKQGLASEDGDCSEWSNDQRKLCYRCDSCKAGSLQLLKDQWKATYVYLAGVIGFLLLVFMTGCCALRNNRADMYGRYKGAYHH